MSEEPSWPQASAAGATPPGGDLQAIGLTPAEEFAYELLIERPPTTVDGLAVAWTRPEPLGLVLAALEAKGLVYRLAGSPVSYLAAAPDIAVEALLLANEQQLRRARAHADQLIATHIEHTMEDPHEYEPGAVVDVVIGDGPVRQRMTEIRRSARNQIRCLDKPPYLELAGASAGGLEPLASGVTCRTIYERGCVEQPDGLDGIARLIRAGQQSRVWPKLPMQLFLIDEGFAVLPLQREPAVFYAALIIRSCTLLDALVHLFEDLWRRALPLHLPATPTEATRPATATVDKQRLTALILSGLTDQAIARQLGIGHRTVQRHIAALIEDLGVRTRFQAGVQTALSETGQTQTK